MKAKKLICIILCLVLSFTLLSGPWRAEAEAASGVAAIVLAIVGTFVVSAGYSFSTKGELQTATEAFMTSDAAKYVTNISDYVSDIIRLNNATTVFDLAPIVTSEWFIEFWQAILDFFSDGEVEIDNSIPVPPDGYAYYNGILLPTFYIDSEYVYAVAYAFDSYFYICASGANSSTSYFGYDPDKQFFYRTKASYTVYKLNSSGTEWVLNNSASSASGHVYCVNDGASVELIGELIWNSALLYSNGKVDGNYPASDPPVTEGDENVDVIGVSTDSPYYNPDVVTAWVEQANNGAIDWALDSSSVYQDITSSDKTAPITATQTGVLTQTGVQVQTKVEALEGYTSPGLPSVFPFCIPFDIFNFLKVLTAEREAPHFEFVLDFGSFGSQEINIDLSPWDDVASVLRMVELFAFIIGLALATHKLIKW